MSTPLDVDRPRGRLDEPEQAARERRLARPGLTDQPDGLARSDLERRGRSTARTTPDPAPMPAQHEVLRQPATEPSTGHGAGARTEHRRALTRADPPTRWQAARWPAAAGRIPGRSLMQRSIADRAAIGEGASDDGARVRRHRARDRREPRGRAMGPRHGRQQAARVGMRRRANSASVVAGLDHPSRVQHRDAVADAPHDARGRA